MIKEKIKETCTKNSKKILKMFLKHKKGTITPPLPTTKKIYQTQSRIDIEGF